MRADQSPRHQPFRWPCIASVETDKGTVSAPVVVNAAGIWAPTIGKMVGIDIPITPTRGQGVIYQRHWSMPEFRPIFHDGRTDYIFRCEPGNLINVLNTLEIRDEVEIVDPDTMPEDAAPELVDRHRTEGAVALPALEKATFTAAATPAPTTSPPTTPPSSRRARRSEASTTCAAGAVWACSRPPWPETSWRS